MTGSTAERKSGGILSWISTFGKSVGLPAIVSLFVSALVSGAIDKYFESRIENSKNNAEIIIHQKERFDNNNDDLIAAIGTYTGHVLDGSDPKKRELLDAVIIKAQLQAKELSDDLGEDAKSVLSAYSDKIDELRNALRKVEGQSDLRPVLVAAQNILKANKSVNEAVTRRIGVSLF